MTELTIIAKGVSKGVYMVDSCFLLLSLFSLNTFVEWYSLIQDLSLDP